MVIFLLSCLWLAMAGVRTFLLVTYSFMSCGLKSIHRFFPFSPYIAVGILICLYPFLTACLIVCVYIRVSLSLSTSVCLCSSPFPSYPVSYSLQPPPPLSLFNPSTIHEATVWGQRNVKMCRSNPFFPLQFCTNSRI